MEQVKTDSLRFQIWEQLYDLSRDMGEQKNVQAAHPGVVKRLAAQLSALRKGRGLRVE